MQQKNPAQNIFGDMQSSIQDMMNAVPTANPFDMRTIMEAQRKNMQAFAEMNQCMMQGWQALAQRQTQMVSQFVQDNSTFVAAGLTPETIKAACDKTLLNTKELTEIMRKSTIDTAEVISRRMSAGMGEMKNAVRKTDAE